MSETNYRGSATRVVLPGSAQELGRLVILYQKDHTGAYKGEIRALFNPNRISLSASSRPEVSINAAPQASTSTSELSAYTYEPMTLSLTLMFDTSEGQGAGAGLAALFGDGGGSSGTSVLPYTSELAGLLRPGKDMSRPPLCELWWGRYQILRGVLASVTQNFTHFLADGTPVRATLDCQFTEADEPAPLQPRARSGGATLHTVAVGETLQSIAFARYGTPARWQDIARANKIADPRKLLPGLVLKIPPR